MTGTFPGQRFWWVKIPIQLAGIGFLMEIIRRKVQEDKSVWFSSPQVEVRGIFADQYIKSCILGIHLDAQLLNRMKIIRQRESKKDYKLIYWCTSMTAIYTCFYLVQICSRAYNLIVKSQQSQALSERHSICTEPKRKKIPICSIPAIFTSVIFHQWFSISQQRVRSFGERQMNCGIP